MNQTDTHYSIDNNKLEAEENITHKRTFYLKDIYGEYETYLKLKRSIEKGIKYETFKDDQGVGLKEI